MKFVSQWDGWMDTLIVLFVRFHSPHDVHRHSQAHLQACFASSSSSGWTSACDMCPCDFCQQRN